MASFPARVHIILARESSTAVIIRRGPSKTVCVLGWNRKTDAFSIGQWFRGRIYERRCDLSPDGKHFIYFAMNGSWSSEVKGSWSAISRAPYLKAVGLWANGSCWVGGGLFASNTAFWLNDQLGLHEERLRPPAKLRRLAEPPSPENYGGECPGVYYLRLQRDGWVLTGMEGSTPGGRVAIFEKQLLHGWTLEKHAHATLDHPTGKGCYFDSHRLIKLEQLKTLDFPAWEWADLDGKRLVWVEHGILFAAALHCEGLSEPEQLFDFNPLKFEALAAPY